VRGSLANRSAARNLMMRGRSHDVSFSKSTGYPARADAGPAGKCSASGTRSKGWLARQGAAQ
jgi:hypothetical protein